MDKQNRDIVTRRTKKLALRKDTLRVLSGSELSSAHGGTGSVTFEVCQAISDKLPEIFETAQQLRDFNQKWADDHPGNGQVAKKNGTNY
jgi:hypothetical protein